MTGGRRRGFFAVVLVAAPAGVALVAAPGAALDPPHNSVNSINCTSCHMPHHAPGLTLTAVAGNANLCMSCHNPAGLAAARPFHDADQAFPGLRGTSHRWDSGPSGHLEAALTNASSGRVESAGIFTGRIEQTYAITITSTGDVGSATFGWVASGGASGAGTTGPSVAIGDGLSLAFEAGSTSPHFVLGDRWTLYVRSDLRPPDPADPFEAPLIRNVAEGKVTCSSCHNQHDQSEQPFDPAAPAYGGDGTGWGRHYQRVENATNGMCKVCHSARDVQSASQGSHPVGVPIPAGDFRPPSLLPLDAVAGEVQCTTCHAPHFADSGGANGGQGDGYILRAGMGELCYECHTLADREGASHLDPSTGALFPGGQYGSSFPAHAPDKRGFCVNCHWPHGWPDDGAPAQDYPRLWVERYDVADDGTDPDDAEDLCFTCHDGSPASTNLRDEFAEGTNGASIFHHPVADSEQSAGRSVECVDCHNPHRARSDNKLAGVTGVDLAGDPVGPGTAVDREIAEYELCFKCHGDAWNAARPETTNKRLDFQPGNSAFHPVTAAGRNRSANLAGQLLGGLTPTSTIRCTDCHNNPATADAFGPARNSTASPQGPHGSTHASIRRAAYWTDLLGPAGWQRANFELCFLCHDPARLVEARRFDDGASTNFYDDVEGEDNLHWLHLEDRADKSRATCKNCHFNVHSNVAADTTQYRIDGVLFTTPPDDVKTHLISFSPDVQPFGGRARPEWSIDTTTRRRQCFLSCHGFDMEGFPYRPDSGDDDPTVP